MSLLEIEGSISGKCRRATTREELSPCTAVLADIAVAEG